MIFYIVTPTFNSLRWLPRCVRSVADQVGEDVQVHHHVQDGASSDGTREWLQHWQQEHADCPGYRFTFESAPDKGMYDAINTAWAQMPPQADVTAHLNSDEQYFPGALAEIARAFRSSRADIALGAYIIVDAESRYICHRRPVLPHRRTSVTVCEIITCSCFHRADHFRNHSVRFDTRYRALADVIFFRDLVNLRPRFAVLPKVFTGSFTITGDNLAWTETSRSEWAAYLRTLPWYTVKLHGLSYRIVNFLRMLRDCVCPAPRSYSIYLSDSATRTTLPIKHPTCRWGCRSRGED